MPDGLLKGHLTVLGEYDECIDVEHPTNLFIGQYCLMNIDLTLSQTKNVSDIDFSTSISVRKKFIQKILILILN